MWWSGDHEFLVTLTLHWLPDDRLMEGVPRFRALCFFCLPCVPVCGAGCALLGGLELKLILTVLGIGVDRMEVLHPVKRGGGSSRNLSFDRVYTWALSHSRLYPRVMRDARAF